MTTAVDALNSVEAEAAAVAARLAEIFLRPRPLRGSPAVEIERLQRLLALAQERSAQLRRTLRDTQAPRNSPAFAERQYVKQLRARFRLWSQTIAASNQVARTRTWPLFPRRRSVLDLGGVQDALSDRVFTQMHRAINPVDQSESAADLGCWPDIPTTVSLFLEHAHLAYRLLLAQRHQGPMRFIDIGCGGGAKVLLGAQMFDQADGLEYDPAYAVSARRVLSVLGATRCRVIEGDALEFQDYGAYDVLYLYRPIRDAELLVKLETRVLAQARPGAVLLAPYDSFRLQTKGFCQIGKGVFVIGTAAGEALRRDALRIGPHIANPDWPPPPETAWLLPLWRACEANGISPAAYG